MEFKEFFKEYNRMCSSYHNCIGCPIDEEINNRIHRLHANCKNIDLLSEVDAESIVEKWAKEHPVKTYESDFKEKIDDLLAIFPDHAVKNYVKGTDISTYDTLCVADFYFNGDVERARCDFLGDDSCKNCWKREING